MVIQLFYDRVLIKRKPPDEIVRGGIIIPDIAKTRPQEGDVLAVGPGRADATLGWRTPQVRVGDRVLFSKYAGIELKLPDDDGDYIILREEDILGKFPKPGEGIPCESPQKGMAMLF